METRADDTLEAGAARDADAAAGITPGALIGRYEVVERIGSGGMGVVYRARDPSLHREVAIKLVKPERMRGRGGVEHRARLLREARAMAQLGHPNVVRVYDVGEHEEGVFLAMELVEGTDAARWFRQERPEWQRVLAVFRAAGRGLAAAHAAGLVHRDFKPANVLVGDDLRVRVMDFGLARTAEDIRGSSEPLTDPDPGWSEAVTSRGAVVGTPAYMAPEQFLGLAADARSDQYSFCASLWEALFHRLPFGGRTPRAIAAAKANDELRLPPPGSGVPHELVAVLQRGMSAERDRRFESMAAVLRALRAIAEPPREEPARSMPRVPWLAVGAAMLIGAFVVWLATDDPCRPDAETDALRAEYVAALDRSDVEEARRVAQELADRWQTRGCTAVAREWAALAGT